MLHEFITANRDEIIRRCRVRTAERSLPRPGQTEQDYGVPLFLDQLSDQLRLRLASTVDIRDGAVLHGNALLRLGYTVSQVVNDYGNVCQSVTELALETGALIDTDDFRILNHCLDVAIAGAVTEYGRVSDQSTLAAETARGSERLGFLAHEMRNLIHTAIVAFEVLKSGDGGVGGSTGAVLHRSLMGAHDLVGRSLAEVRLVNGVQQLEQFRVADFIEELSPAAALGANARGVTLTIGPVNDAAMIEADRQVLGAVLMNVLQNAFKFTRPRTVVCLRVIAGVDRVMFEVEDECGGLPEGDAEELFRPFEQRSANRTGLGLGLAFSRWAVDAHRGEIYSRSLAGKGCIFTVALPRFVPADAAPG